MKSQGFKQFYIYYTENGGVVKYTWLSAKQVNKLFGKMFRSVFKITVFKNHGAVGGQWIKGL